MLELIRSWERTFFTEPLLGLVLCIALAIAIKYRKKHEILKKTPSYIIAFLLIIISSVARTLSSEGTYYYKLIDGLNEYIDYLFTLIELIVFSHIYYHLTNNYTTKKIIVAVNILFIPFFLFMLFQDKYFYTYISHSTQSKVYTVEGLLLLPICLSYFIGLFRKPSHLNLKNEPGFWISVGLLFFLTCTLPYSLLEHYLLKKKYFSLLLQLYPIFYIFYILLFSMIIRAYLCKKEKTNSVLNNY